MSNIKLKVEDNAIHLKYVEGKLKPEQARTVNPLYTRQTVYPEDGYTLSSVTVEAIPHMTDVAFLRENGTHDVEFYGTAIVNTDPERGLVFRNYDSNGRPQSAELVGEWNNIPSHYFDKMFCNDAYAPGDYFGKNISTFTIPDSVYTINSSAFYLCSALEEIIFPDNSIACYKEMCSGCSRLMSVEFKRDVVFFDNSQFSNCSALTSVIFGGEVSAITNSAFRYDTNIMLYDFSHCSAVPPLYSAASLGHADGCVLLVPSSLLTEWQNTTNWSILQNVVWEAS